MFFMCSEHFSLKKKFYCLEKEMNEKQFHELEIKQQNEIVQKIALKYNSTKYINNTKNQTWFIIMQSQSQYNLQNNIEKLFINDKNNMKKNNMKKNNIYYNI